MAHAVAPIADALRKLRRDTLTEGINSPCNRVFHWNTKKQFLVSLAKFVLKSLAHGARAPKETADPHLRVLDFEFSN
jgi:hypothetical protein